MDRIDRDIKPIDIHKWRDEDLYDEIARIEEHREPGYTLGFLPGMRAREMRMELRRRGEKP
jgi:hypothetical protein